VTVDSSGVLKELEAGYSLPSLSVVALRLVELAADDTCSARDLDRLIEKDPTLALRLLPWTLPLTVESTPMSSCRRL
jgi:hypothetical protein